MIEEGPAIAALLASQHGVDLFGDYGAGRVDAWHALLFMLPSSATCGLCLPNINRREMIVPSVGGRT